MSDAQPLLSCPFCGGGFRSYENYPWGRPWLEHVAEGCPIGGARMPDTPDAHAAWNTRAFLPEQESK